MKERERMKKLFIVQSDPFTNNIKSRVYGPSYKGKYCRNIKRAKIDDGVVFTHNFFAYSHEIFFRVGK
jgi:hypothetical protein